MKSTFTHLNRAVQCTFSVVTVLTALALLAAPANADGSDVSAYVFIGSGNNGFSAGDADFSGLPFASLAYSQTFTGKDSQGASQTMTFNGSGSSSAEFGRLHAKASGTISNPYYNSANPVFYAGGDIDLEGSPGNLRSHAQAEFRDTFTYTGLNGLDYKVRYLFHVDGLSTASADWLAYSEMIFTVEGQIPELFRTIGTDDIWATQTYDVAWGSPFGVESKFAAIFAQNLATNTPSFVEGETIWGTADYSSTMTLTGVEIYDKDGNLANGWSLSAASGTRYPAIQGGAQAVPEPGSLAMFACMGVAGLVMLRRRR